MLKVGEGFLMSAVASVCRVDPVNTRGKAAIDINRVYTTHRFQAGLLCI